MKLQVEQGIVDFIAAAIRQRDGLAADAPLPIAVLPYSGESVVDFSGPAILVLVEEEAQASWSIARAQVSIAVSTPIAQGQRESHDEWGAFLQRIFPPVSPPYLPQNVVHLSHYLFAACGDTVCSGWHVHGSEGSTADGRWISSRRMVVGLGTGQTMPPEAPAVDSIALGV